MLYLQLILSFWLAVTSWFNPDVVKKRKLVWREEFNATGQPSLQDWVY